MNVFQLECFLAVVETLNFARAAEKMSITQPAVTHQIRALEEELNVKLFHRSTRSVALSSAGFAFLPDARGIVEISVRARKRFEDPSGREVQPFDLGFQSHTQQSGAVAPLRQLRQLYPNVHPRFRVAPFQHLCHMLEEESLEAFVGFREPDARRKALSYREIAQSPLCWIAPPEHPLAGQGEPAHLGRERMVLSSPIHTPAPLVRLHRELIGDRTPAELYFCEMPEEVLTLVKAGYGISLVPEPFVPPDSGLVRIPARQIAPLSYGVYYKTVQGNRVLKDFIRLLRQDDPPVQ